MPGDDYTAIGLDDYVRSLDLAAKPARSADKVAVIVAAGTILDGRAAVRQSSAAIRLRS